ncbi:MAG: electron transfer flavoprotein subunit alpha/FixB family protein [Sphingomonadales bacterium]|nr:electron transfer flavoprotein subunit alpha/FixB family protein [Sphingomonadales bacterium]
MKILVYAEQQDGHLKKSAVEAVSFAKQSFESLGNINITVLLGGQVNQQAAADLGKYGANSVWMPAQSTLNAFEVHLHSAAIQQALVETEAEVLVMAHTYCGKSLAPRLSVAWDAALAAGVNGPPECAADGSWKVQRTVYSNKGIATYSVWGARRILTFTPNALKPSDGASPCAVTAWNVSLDSVSARTRNLELQKVQGKIPLTEAERVISGGRGLKGPEHWHLIEDLAEACDAATACSKPVSDMHWRSHDEHVGQTGITIKPDLYIAVGISGAIQHLAGVSSSKTIVAINTDQDAPFFKVADYGVVGDAFEVLPQLTQAIRRLRKG